MNAPGCRKHRPDFVAPYSFQRIQLMQIRIRIIAYAAVMALGLHAIAAKDNPGAGTDWPSKINHKTPRLALLRWLS
jgi:hypothetical protein